MGFLSHIKWCTNDDRFPLSIWLVWFCNHLQTCQVKSAASRVHDWVVHRFGGLLGSVGHRVKIHKVTSVTGKERGDLEIKDYVVLQKPQEQADRLPPPRTLIMDFTLTHTRFGRSSVHPIGQLTHTRRSDGTPTRLMVI